MFLTNNEYRQEVINAISKSTQLSIAVAFWGKDSENLFNNKFFDQARIICNLISGGTNPEPIHNLKNIKNIDIRQLNSLHAKVIIGDNFAIIGSANFSTNGINHENDENIGWNEAGFITRKIEDINSAQLWFNDLWNLSKKITNIDLNFAKQQWETRRSNRAYPKKLNNFLENIPTLKDRLIYIVITEDDASYTALEKFENQLKIKSDVCDSKFLPVDELDFFIGAEDLPKESTLISIRKGKRKNSKLKLLSISKRVPELDFIFQDDDGKNKAMQIVIKQEKIFGMPFDKNNIDYLLQLISTKNWDKIIKKAENYNLSWAIPLYDILSIENV